MTRAPFAVWLSWKSQSFAVLIINRLRSMSRTEGIIIMLPSGPSLQRQTEELETLSPMGTITDSKEIAEAVVYLTEARHGEVLHADDGAHVGRW